MTLICPVCESQNESAGPCLVCSADLGPLERIASLPGESYREGMALLEKGEAGAALAPLSAAAALNSQAAEVHLALARACVAQGLGDSAREHLDRAAELAPGLDGIGELRTTLQAAQTGRENAEKDAVRRARKTRSLLWSLPAAGFLAGLATLAALRPAPPPAPAPATEVAAAAPAPTPPPPPQVAQESAVEYRIRPGDSLWLIARRKYGSSRFWERIREANPDKTGPAGLKVGDTLRLPAVTIQPR